MSTSTSASNSWLDKYRPRTLDEMIGVGSKLDVLRNWIEKKEYKEKPLLMCGPPGIGKTTMAQVLLREYGFDPSEYNASDLRNKKNIAKVLRDVVGSTSVEAFLTGKKQALVLDEIDGMKGSKDKSGLKELFDYVSTKRLHVPIICTYNNFSSTNLTKLRKISQMVYLNKPNVKSCETLINRIVEAENMNMCRFAVLTLAKYLEGDYRTIINSLWMLRDIFDPDGTGEREIEMDDVKALLETSMIKDENKNTYETVGELFRGEDMSIESCVRSSYSDNHKKMLSPLLVHQNYPQVVKHGENYLYLHQKIMEGMVANDLMTTTIYKAPEMREITMPFCSIFSMFNASVYIPKNIRSIKIEIKSSEILNKISLSNTKKRAISSIREKTGLTISNEDIKNLSTMLSVSVFTHERFDKVLDIMKYYNLYLEDLQEVVGLNKDKKSKFTDKYRRIIVIEILRDRMREFFPEISGEDLEVFLEKICIVFTATRKKSRSEIDNIYLKTKKVLDSLGLTDYDKIRKVFSYKLIERDTSKIYIPDILYNALESYDTSVCETDN